MKAETNFKLGDRNCILIYDWDAVSELEKKFTIEKLADILSKPTMGELADILECGLKRYHPEIKAEDIFELSPPILEAKGAVEKALSLAYFGTLTPEKKDGDVKKKKKKANCFWPIVLGFALGYSLVNFGYLPLINYPF